MKKYDDPGQYMVNFNMDGKEYGFVMPSESAEDANRRLAAIRTNGRVVGGPCYSVKLPMPLMYLALPFLVLWTAMLNLFGVKGERS